MPGKIVYKPKEQPPMPHVSCDDKPKDCLVGTIWQCDCGKYWEFYWDPYKTGYARWNRIWKIGAKRIIKKANKNG